VPSLASCRRALAGRTIHVIPYTHADVAWVHSRDWHVDRYTRAMDEILDLLDRDPSFRYYVDTWTEWIKPYIGLRPRNVERLRRHVESGRLAVCCGHYGNVRSTAVGDETFIRNLQLGMRRWKELAPDVRFNVYANMDVAIGHSQVPQLLRLAGISNYFAWRPEAGLDKEGVPRAFHWRGLSGDTVLVCRVQYGGLYTTEERHGDTWDADWDGVVTSICERYLGTALDDAATNVPLCVGSDDSRPDRFNYRRDAPCNYDELIRIWNERESSRMRFGNPDELFASLAAESGHIATIEGVIDPADVCYNAGWNGRHGIWWLREQADRLLVDAEILATLAQVAKGVTYPSEDLAESWERLLDNTPHAVQFLFEADWRAARLSLQQAIDASKKVTDCAVNHLVGGCLPMDAGGLAIVNPLPARRREVIPLWIVNSDLTRGMARLVDARGKEVPGQVFYAGPHANGEYGLLADVDAPACGYAGLRMRHGKEMPQVPAFMPVAKDTLRLASDKVALSFRDGRLVRIQDLVRGTDRRAIGGASFLEPVYYPMASDDWFVGSGIPHNPEGFTVNEVRLDEQGPLRWRVTRVGTTAGFWVRQHLDLIRGERAVRCTTEFSPPSEPRQGLLALSVPLPRRARLTADIPFGVEPRNVESLPYVGFERVIPGMFWARTWVAAQNARGLMALLAEDGDKYYRAFGKPRRLVHFLARRFPHFERIWESQTAAHELSGPQEFHHRLVLGDRDWRKADLVGLAERVRHPLRQQWVREAALGRDVEWLKISPATVRLSALACDGASVLLRVVQMAPRSAQVTVSLPFEPQRAQFVDLSGNVLPIEVALNGSTITFQLAPWRIATLRLRHG
jgi:alpha-mannosidase